MRKDSVLCKHYRKIMKIVFVSNFMNHHQLDLCNALNANCESFFFVEMEKMPEEVSAFGYENFSELEYVVSKPKNEDEEKKVINLIMDADAVIFGACSSGYLEMRMSENKLSFVFSERLWKKGYYRRFIPLVRKKVMNKFVKNKNRRLYVLSASCYLAHDLKIIGFPIEKCYKWGYFTPIEFLDSKQVLSNKQENIKILYVGRFIKLKHVEDIIKALFILKRKGYLLELELIGSGERKKKYEYLIKKYNLQREVSFGGNKSQKEIREKMRKAHILVFASDFREGWGAVVNEAMNSLCVPIVSHAAGSSKFLLEEGKNGWIYKYSSIKDLCEKIEKLITDRELLNRFAENAYQTIVNDYNGEEAAKRLIRFVECVENKESLPRYEKGPLSLAPDLKNNWIRGKI